MDATQWVMKGWSSWYHWNSAVNFVLIKGYKKHHSNTRNFNNAFIIFLFDNKDNSVITIIERKSRTVYCTPTKNKSTGKINRKH